MKSFLTKKKYVDLYANRQTLSDEISNFLRRYSFIAQSLYEKSPKYSYEKSKFWIVSAVCTEIMVTEKRLIFIDKDLKTCSNILFFKLRELGITDEMLNEIDVEYEKMIDEGNRIKGMSFKDKIEHIANSKIFNRAKLLIISGLIENKKIKEAGGNKLY